MQQSNVVGNSQADGEDSVIGRIEHGGDARRIVGVLAVVVEVPLVENDLRRAYFLRS